MVISSDDGRPSPSGLSPEAENEACRKVLIALCGSEEKARALGEALLLRESLRYTTPEEDRLVEQWYDEGDRIASQTLDEAGLVAVPTQFVGPDQEEPELTEDEERELTTFLEAVYRRAEERN